MADTKITGLPENTTPVATDIIAMIDDPAGTPASNRVTFTNLMALFANPVSDDGVGLGTTGLKWADVFLASGAVINFNSGDVTLTHSADALTLAGGRLQLAAGSATVPPIDFDSSGALMTTPEDGSLEMDANCLYGCTDAGNRGVIPIMHIIRQDASRALTSTVAEQQLFNSATNGRLTLETGVYYFIQQISLSGMSATNGNAALDILGAGSATLGTVLRYDVGADVAINASGNQTGSTSNVAQTIASALSASTAAAMQCLTVGTFEVTAAGTIVPSITLVTAAAATVAAGCYFRCWRAGSTSMANVGQWD